MDAFKQIAALQRNAREFSTFWERYKKHTSESTVDKYAAKFGGDDRFIQFRVNTFFESHSGVYGSSSCSCFGHFDSELSQKYMVEAMNALRGELFQKVAEMMQRDAANLVEKARAEVAAMNAALDAVLEAEASA